MIRGRRIEQKREWGSVGPRRVEESAHDSGGLDSRPESVSLRAVRRCSNAAVQLLECEMQEANVGAKPKKKGVIERSAPRFRAWLQISLMIWAGVATEIQYRRSSRLDRVRYCTSMFQIALWMGRRV